MLLLKTSARFFAYSLIKPESTSINKFSALSLIKSKESQITWKISTATYSFVPKFYISHENQLKNQLTIIE